MSNQIKVADFRDIIGMADPASGKLTAGGAQHAIVIVGQAEDGKAFMLDEWAERTSSDVLVRQIFTLNSRWRCRRFGLESVGQQNLFFQSTVREADMRRERIALVPIDQPTTQDKEFRITSTIQKWCHNGLLFVNETCTGTLRQLERYPAGLLCDLVDALASALNMLRDPFANKRGLLYDPDYDEMARYGQSQRVPLDNVRRV